MGKTQDENTELIALFIGKMVLTIKTECLDCQNEGYHSCDTCGVLVCTHHAWIHAHEKHHLVRSILS